MLNETQSKGKTNAKVDSNLTEKYKGKVIFPEKLEWAKAHIKGRNIAKEIEVALEKINTTSQL